MKVNSDFEKRIIGEKICINQIFPVASINMLYDLLDYLIGSSVAVDRAKSKESCEDRELYSKRIHEKICQNQKLTLTEEKKLEELLQIFNKAFDDLETEKKEYLKCLENILEKKSLQIKEYKVEVRSKQQLIAILHPLTNLTIPTLSKRFSDIKNGKEVEDLDVIKSIFSKKQIKKFIVDERLKQVERKRYMLNLTNYYIFMLLLGCVLFFRFEQYSYALYDLTLYAFFIYAMTLLEKEYCDRKGRFIYF